jgi:hypothetical protein
MRMTRSQSDALFGYADAGVQRINFSPSVPQTNRQDRRVPSRTKTGVLHGSGTAGAAMRCRIRRVGGGTDTAFLYARFGVVQTAPHTGFTSRWASSTSETHCRRSRQSAYGLPNSLPVTSHSWRSSVCSIADIGTCSFKTAFGCELDS